jgi:DNA-binding NarL/FixJ family response regulator
MKPAILLIDDHALFRAGLRLLLGSSIPEAEVVEAGSLGEALGREMAPPGVILLDIKLPDLNGMEGIAVLKRCWPSAPVLILSSCDAPETEREAHARGAAGFISKAETADRMVDLVRRSLRGQLAASEAANGGASTRSLTQRQAEVLAFLGQGLSNKLIARRLSLSENTVRRHVQDILEHFQVASRAEAVYAARRQGLLD